MLQVATEILATMYEHILWREPRFELHYLYYPVMAAGADQRYWNSIGCKKIIAYTQTNSHSRQCLEVLLLLEGAVDQSNANSNIWQNGKKRMIYHSKGTISTHTIV